MMKKTSNLLIMTLGLGFSHLQAQTDGFLFNYTGMGAATALATDYQAIGINPANLGYDNDYQVAFGFAEPSFSIYSEALLRDDLQQFSIIQFNELSSEQQVDLANALVEDGYEADFKMNAFSISFDVGKAGSFALGAGVNMNQTFQLGGEASNLVFQGFNYEGYIDTIIIAPDGDPYGVSYDPLSLADLTEGTRLNLNLSQTFSLAWGKEMYSSENVNLFAGLGIHYHQSYGYIDYSSEQGVIGGQGAVSFDIIDTASINNPAPRASTPVGTGIGLDLGISAHIGEKLILSVSAVQLGSMKYKLNTVQFNNIVLDTIYYNGMENTDPISLLDQWLGDENLLSTEASLAFRAPLHSMLRAGAAYHITPTLTVAGDVNVPLSETASLFEGAQFGAGVRLGLVGNLLLLSGGITAGGNYGVNIPVGLVVNLPFWEFGISTRDASIFLGEKSSIISWSVGVLRFKL